MHSSTVNGTPAIGAAIDRARMKAGLSEKELAFWQGISPAQWSRQQHGMGHIALDRLAETPRAFRAALIEELEALWGMETTFESLRRDLAVIKAALAQPRR